MSLIRVLEIPPATGNWHFGGGEPQTFVEVDWFRDDEYPPPDKWEPLLTDFIKSKKYYREGQAYLVLGPERSFTINYRAP